MILKKEVEKIALQKEVAKSTIDKDWVLGHFVDAIYSVPKCRESLVFKGGTCLKKCYFPDYRFSEDLDFTSVDPDFKLDKKLIGEILDHINDHSEIPIHLHELKPLQFQNKLTGYAAVIKFWGADHPRNQAPPPPARWLTSVKIEIIIYEQMVFPAEKRSIYHEYSDQLLNASDAIPCYSIHEVLAEKLRSLIQRSYTAPRDFYDIWYLSQNARDLDWDQIISAFHQKMKFKGLEFTGIDQMINDENDKRLQAAWKNSLTHQVPDNGLPPYKKVRNTVLELLNQILVLKLF